MFEKLKLAKRTRDELKAAKKEKKRCKKLYLDWRDDEYNCGPLKYIWGIRDTGESADNFEQLTDLDIYYNRDTKKYILALETIYIFPDDNSKIKYLDTLLKKFEQHVYHQLQEDAYSPKCLRTYNDGNLFQADSEIELFYKFKIFVIGYSNL